MSSSESDSNEELSESEVSTTDNDDNVGDIANGMMNDMHITTVDDIDDNEDYYDIDNMDHFQELYDLYQKPASSDLTQIDSMDQTLLDHIRPAMTSVFQSSSSLKISLPKFGDSLDAYLSSTPLIERIPRKQSFYFTYEPVTSASSAKLFVGNVPLGTTWEQLKSFFDGKGYRVKHIHIPSKPGKSGFAIIKFMSATIANLVLHDYQRNSNDFFFRLGNLRISNCKPSSKKSSNNIDTITRTNMLSGVVDLEISNVYYGTLITAATMKNINKSDNTAIDRNEFGIIAQNLIQTGYNLPIHFVIDEKNKKFSIVVKNNSLYNDFMIDGVDNTLYFEWNFRDLKGHKISPVLVNKRDVYLIMQLKQPPIILQKTIYPNEDDIDETRLPGTPSLGHANGWLFKLNYTNLNVYAPLFKVLRRYNLTPRPFSEHNIIDLVRLNGTAENRLTSVHILSNEVWIKQNFDKVERFRSCRWPSYPFETKFELMKLIAKHIITFHDLIVDDHLETILEQCSMNTLTSCIEKILEQAPRWFSSIYDNDEEDYDQENNEQYSQEESDEEAATSVQNSSINDNEVSEASQFQSSTGISINISSREQIEITTDQTKLNKIAKEHQLGIFSRLLLFALRELINKYQLRRINPARMYITKHEARSLQTTPYQVRKIYITPSTIFYEGPYREEKSAVTRHFERQQDRFLRVTFRDEDYRVLHNYNDNMTRIYDRIKQILIYGITICDRKYDFLAFSSSQLRDHSCWMFADMNDGINAEYIRQWMGDFSKARPVAKLAARLGQSFSICMRGLKLKTSEFRQISDVSGRDVDGRIVCFTDGIGIIAPWLAEKLTQEVYPSGTATCPSAFQIRCGGFKGMVCLDVNNIIPPGPVGVHFRDSMDKFTAGEFSIDVVRTSSHPSVAYLNRQIILLLSTLGIPDQVFLSFQERMLQRLVELTADPKKACDTLRDYSEYGGNGCHGFLIDYINKLRKWKDPFVRRIIVAIQAFLVKELRTRAKILVPNSWCLFGVVDESRQLNYGQVFIQIDNTNQQGGSVTILQGPVVVTRNPCFHPGDIRRLEAVDVPALRGLKNVIVFPIKGLRPHPMEMSGGDLDGDTFWICTEKELIFPYNEQPFRYVDQAVEVERQAQLQTGTQFTIKDVCNFFGEYIEADNLGLIANSHLAFADQLPEGAKAQTCLKLAQMHSIAVDFAKNGISAPKLTRDYRPKIYPHYMEKKDKLPYHSTTILGKLYDAILDYKIDLNVDEKEEIAATFRFPYQSFHVNQYEDYKKDAESNKHDYDLEIKRVMRQYGIKHEVELVSGYILKFISKQYSNETKLFDLRNEISHAYRVIRDKYLRIFWEQFFQRTSENSTDEQDDDEEIKWTQVSKKLTWKNQVDFFERHRNREIDDEIKKKASAWFHVTYDPWIKYMKQNNRSSRKNRNTHTNNDQSEDRQKFKGLFSFAWIIYPVLLSIYNQTHKDLPINSESKKKKKRKKKNKNAR